MSHFSSVGLNIHSAEDFNPLLEKIAIEGQYIETSIGGYYVVLRQSPGVELWGQANPNREMIGCHPHYSGKSSVHVKMKLVEDKQGSPLDGFLHCWIISRSENDQEYPFLVNCPSFRLVSDQERECDVQVTAFAEEVVLYSNAEELSKNNIYNLASQAFIPAGLFVPEGSDKPAEPIAIFSGKVINVEKKSTGFWLLYVESLSAGYDVVIDPQLLKVEPVPGMYIAGVFWLSGVVI